jgi:hypothetical protein
MMITSRDSDEGGLRALIEKKHEDELSGASECSALASDFGALVDTMIRV